MQWLISDKIFAYLLFTHSSFNCFLCPYYFSNKKKYENSKDTKCSTTPFPMLIRDYNQLTLVELLTLLYGQQEPRQYINFLI